MTPRGGWAPQAQCRSQPRSRPMRSAPGMGEAVLLITDRFQRGAAYKQLSRGIP